MQSLLKIDNLKFKEKIPKVVISFWSVANLISSLVKKIVLEKPSLPLSFRKRVLFAINNACLMFKTDPDYFAIIYFLPPCSCCMKNIESWVGKFTVPVQGEISVQVEGEISVPVQSEPLLSVPVENSCRKKNWQ